MNNRYHIIGIDKKCLFSLWIKLEFSSFNDIDHSLGKAVENTIPIQNWKQEGVT